MQAESHDVFAPYEFMADSVVEEAFDLLAPLLASFGPKVPLLSKFRVAGSH